MTVGVAYSGGGIVALVGGMCSMDWLSMEFPGVFDPNGAGKNLVLSTVSGGSLAQALVTNVGEKLSFPRYDPNMAYATASNQTIADGKEMWFANGLNVLPPIRRLADGEKEGGLFSGVTGWVGSTWQKLVYELYYREYGLEELKGGDLTWYNDFTYVNADKAPVSRNSDGYMDDPKGSIGMGYREMKTGKMYPENVNATVMEALAWSSAFWATLPLISNIVAFDMTYWGLPHDTNYYFADGGLIDPAGITNLLKAQTDTVVAFYNNLGNIAVHTWQIAMLFGINSKIPLPSTVGGIHTQVFPEKFGAEVMANLTNPKILRAQLTDVPVLENEWLGIKAYTLKTLIIVSSMYSDEFVDSFTDPEIKKHLSRSFPTGYHSGMPTLDANMFCMFNQWRSGKYRDEISAALKQS